MRGAKTKEKKNTPKKKSEAEDWTQLEMTVMNFIELSVRGTNAALLHIKNTK